MDPLQLLANWAGKGGQKQNKPKISTSNTSGNTYGNTYGTTSDVSINNSFATTSEFSVNRLTKITTNEDARGLLSDMMTRELGRRPRANEVDRFQAALNEAQRNNPFVTTRNATGYTQGSSINYTQGTSQGSTQGGTQGYSQGSSLAGSRGGPSSSNENSTGYSNNSSNTNSSSNSNSYSNSNSFSDSNSYETGGVNPQQFAQDYVINDDPASEYGKYQAATTFANALFQAIRSPV